MENYRQIENLIYRYAELIDAGDLSGLAQLFRRGEIVSAAHGMRRSGYDEVLQLYQLSTKLYQESGTPLTKHITTNVIIELDLEGEGASARSYFTVIQATSLLPLQPIISGRYHDRFRRFDDKWEFSSREMIVDLIGDCSGHLLYDSNGLK